MWAGSEVTGQAARGVGLVQMESASPHRCGRETDQARPSASPREGADFGGYNAILWDKKNRTYWGATEMRKDGVAIGY
jgi:gamma-glutamyltranspeptidase/glutathione hydrolase